MGYAVEIGKSVESRVCDVSTMSKFELYLYDRSITHPVHLRPSASDEGLILLTACAACEASA